MFFTFIYPLGQFHAAFSKQCFFFVGKLSTPHAPFVELAALPTSLKEERHAAVPASSVLWNQEGNLLAGCSNELHLYDSDLNVLKASPIKQNGNVTSMAEKLGSSKEDDNMMYIVATYRTTYINEYRSTYAYKLYMYSSDLEPSAVSMDEDCQTRRLGERRVAVNPLTSQVIVCSTNQLQVFSKDADFEYLVTFNGILEPNGLHILSDGSVLLSCEGLVYKYTLRPPPKKNFELIWKTENLDKPTGISSDSAGLIYVGVRGGIQVISSQGMHAFTAFCRSHSTCKLKKSIV